MLFKSFFFILFLITAGSSVFIFNASFAYANLENVPEAISTYLITTALKILKTHWFEIVLACITFFIYKKFFSPKN